jgi:hypothetical protein
MPLGKERLRKIKESKLKKRQRKMKERKRCTEENNLEQLDCKSDH